MYDTPQSSDPVLPLSPAEQKLVNQINATWTKEQALTEVKSHLQIAVEIELATLPIYLYTYYSINRTPGDFPSSDVSRFADKAGANIMSVAVEEMLHMSLASNLLYSLGGDPQLYGKSPWPYPTNLPGHAKMGPDHEPLQIPLAKFSREQLWQFLEIEYPSTNDAPPESDQWDTIGQIYSYIRCIISSNLITDADFQVRASDNQIQNTNYSPNNIDTVYPTGSFNKTCPVPTPTPGSAATVADFTSRDDSHAGSVELLTIDSCETALQAIQTIDAQGEGYGPSKFDDPSQQELSHYYKFLTLQSELEGYPGTEPLPAEPAPPAPSANPITQADLDAFVFDYPENPVAADYEAGYSDCANVVNGLYQYMLIMTESIFKITPSQQKLYFNQALHRSMIWILDKVIQAMRKQQAPVKSGCVVREVAFAPSFENVDLGSRQDAFANLVKMCKNLDNKYGSEKWYTETYINYYIGLIPSLYDVSPLWGYADQPIGAELTAQQGVAKTGTPVPGVDPVIAAAKETAKASKCDVTPYAGIPKFPQNPPASVGADEVRHACMGLNHCAGQGRTRDNTCAGQGYCSTALAYNYGDPGSPMISDHTCHVKNNCAGQGGCGLYGTGEEQNNPGGNDCATLGSCATPINAERFSTMGPNQGKSVWVRAREVFETETWPKLRAKKPSLPEVPAPVPHPDLFKYGPTIEWIQDYSGEGMTACGASGMSGAGSCS